MRKIAIEEHFITRTFEEYLQKQAVKRGNMSGGLPPHIVAQMRDIGEGRLRALDDAGIDMQVLSLSVPGLEQIAATDAVPLAKDVNEELAAAVRQHPTRFAGFAALPTTDPQAAADELERAVRTLGLKGAMIHGNPQGTFLDDRANWEIFARAEALNVPLYLHPAPPTPDTLQAYEGRPELIGPLWSFTVDAATQMLRLVVSGVFDQYPGLTIILGHLGETLPYLLGRLDSRWQFYASRGNLQKRPSDYLRENMLVTTSGIFYNPALVCACMALGVDRILFAVDTPYEPNQAATAFIEAAPLSEAEKQQICHLNAERLFGLQAGSIL